jgi:hypothetical protein
VSSTAVVTGVAFLTGAVTLEVSSFAVIGVLETANELDVAAASDVGVKVNVKLPVPVTTKLVNVATPPTAVTVLPERVPVPEAIDATTATVDDETKFPFASTMRITGCVVRAERLIPLDG